MAQKKGHYRLARIDEFYRETFSIHVSPSLLNDFDAVTLRWSRNKQNPAWTSCQMIMETCSPKTIAFASRLAKLVKLDWSITIEETLATLCKAGYHQGAIHPADTKFYTREEWPVTSCWSPDTADWLPGVFAHDEDDARRQLTREAAEARFYNADQWDAWLKAGRPVKETIEAQPFPEVSYNSEATETVAD